METDIEGARREKGMQTLGEQIPYLGPWTVWPSQKEARCLHDLLGNAEAWCAAVSVFSEAHCGFGACQMSGPDMCYILPEKFVQMNWDHGTKGKGLQSHSRRCTRCWGRSSNRACICIVLGECSNSL